MQHTAMRDDALRCKQMVKICSARQCTRSMPKCDAMRCRRGAARHNHAQHGATQCGTPRHTAAYHGALWCIEAMHCIASQCISTHCDAPRRDAGPCTAMWRGVRQCTACNERQCGTARRTAHAPQCNGTPMRCGFGPMQCNAMQRRRAAILPHTQYTAKTLYTVVHCGAVRCRATHNTATWLGATHNVAVHCVAV